MQCLFIDAQIGGGVISEGGLFMLFFVGVLF